MVDAMTLARLIRIDPNLLCPVKRRRAEAQADLTVIRARAALVRTRTMLVNAVCGLTKSSYASGGSILGQRADLVRPRSGSSMILKLEWSRI